MVADDSLLEGQVLRVRTWACRPRERPKEWEFKRAPCREVTEQLSFISPPPGLEQSEEEEETEGNQLRETRTPGSVEQNEVGEPSSMPDGDLLAVAREPQEIGETKQGKGAKEEGGEETESAEKEVDGSSEEARTGEQNKGSMGKAERTKEGGRNEQEENETSRIGEGREQAATGGEGTGGGAGTGGEVSGKGKLKGRGNKQTRTKGSGSKQDEGEKPEGGKEDDKVPTDPIFPTPDEAEWASQKLVEMGMPEELCKAIEGIRDRPKRNSPICSLTKQT